jgi:SAM-dependent methyltransferase
MNRLLTAFRQSLDEQTLLKLSLSKPTPAAADLKNVYARLVQLKTGVKVQFTLRYKFRDITKNLDINEAVAALAEWLTTDFEMANLHTKTQIVSLEQKQGKNPKFSVSENKNTENKPTTDVIRTNDHQKKRRIAPENSIWLHRLGITNREGVILKEKQSKFKQIDKYLEIIDSLLSDFFIPKTAKNTEIPLRIADMGAGKGYLTFALYDFLGKNTAFSPTIIGVETRPELIAACNGIAEESGFAHLHFAESTIADFDANGTNMLIALHACDTATDDAIAKGIAANADIIVVAPCCHKQVRRAMQPTGTMKTLLQNGIHTERQAELLTDSVRALLLQAEGYTVKVQEFISLEHTGKNILITAVKHRKKVDKNAIYTEINEILANFGVKNHYLYDIQRDKYV